MAGQQELARDLGFLEAYTIGVGTMIGAGIFVLPSIVAASAGPAGMISFTIGGVVSLLTALSLSELATGMPRAGGSYYYVNTAMGSFFGSIPEKVGEKARGTVAIARGPQYKPRSITKAITERLLST